MEVLEGILERITFYSEDTSYLVGSLSRSDRKGERVTFVGYFPRLQEGETLRLKGEWKIHPRYGKQFRVEEWESVTPATQKGLKSFLSSGLIKGVGSHTAGLLIDRFGMETLEIIEGEPGRLVEISGIGPKRAALIHQSYERHKEIKEVMIFLQSHGVSPSLAVRLFKFYGQQAIAVLQENPYRLAEEVYGVGFITADRVARQLGLPFNSPQRVRAAVLFLLQQAAGEGHVYLPAEELREKVVELLLQREANETRPTTGERGKDEHRQGLSGEEISPELVTAQVEQLAADRLVFMDQDREGREIVYAAPFYHAEKGAARKLKELINRQLVLFAPEEESVVQEILQKEKIELAPEQAEAVSGALRHGVMVITGGPGTGKTTTIKTLISLFRHYKLKVQLAAPTGRAAKRMTEATGMEARTVHRLLEYSFEEGRGFCFQRNEENPLPAQALIVDEVSMMDLVLFYNLLKAVPPGCRLVLVGDVDQLPSVGAGNVLRDIIQSGALPCVRLNTIFRQARESMIVVNAHRVNTGEFPYLNKRQKDFFFIKEEDPEKVAATIVELCRERLPRFGSYDPREEIQVLTPMRKTPVGVERMNYLLQQQLNPPSPHKAEIYSGGFAFRAGDKVMQIRNNYEKEVFNGDMGRITRIDGEEGELWVSFPDVYGAREVTYDLLELDELVLSYAVSVHKSQGSEYPVVVMPLVTQHYILLQRNLLYTAITRAKNMVVLIGTRKALAIAIGNNKVERRYSELARRLRE